MEHSKSFISELKEESRTQLIKKISKWILIGLTIILLFLVLALPGYLSEVYLKSTGGIVAGVSTLLLVLWLLWLLFRVRSYKAQLDRLKINLVNKEESLLIVQKNFESYVASQRAKEVWKFDSKLGYYYQEGSQVVLCPNCYAKDLKSPLKVQENGWLCLVSDCGHFSRNPEYKAPPPVLRKRRDSGPSWLQGF